MPETGQHVFISYKTEDRDVARKVRANLALALKCEIWWDQNLQTGGRWSTEIDTALRTAACVVVLWSERSADSPWVQQEAAVAKVLGTISPAVIEACEVPAPYRSIQAARLQDWDFTETHPEFVKLVERVRSCLKRSKAQKLRRPLALAGALAILALVFALGAWSGGRLRPPAEPSPARGGAASELDRSDCDAGAIEFFEDAPSAVTRTVKASYGRSEQLLFLCLDSATLGLRENPGGYNGPRTLESLRLGVACPGERERTWEVVRYGGRHAIGQSLAPGESLTLSDLYFAIPVASIADLHRCWVVLETEESTGQGVGISYARSDRDFFRQ